MISKIDNIKDFGIYKDFIWANNTSLKEFREKNLFYGWNYSGKTTLSRIFSSLRDREILESYSKGSFKVTTDVGIFDKNNLSTFPYNLLVFNSDYIIDNLNFSLHKDSTTDSKTILFEVGDNAKYEAKITQLKELIDQINGTNIIVGKKIKYQKDIDEFESYDRDKVGKFTSFAKEIKDDYFYSLINFTKANLKSTISTVKGNQNGFIIKDKKEIETLHKLVKSSEAKDILNVITLNSKYPDIIEQVNIILDSTSDKNILINILDKNYESYNWVNKGLELNMPNEKCLFCDNVVTEDRINKLQDYFNSQASKTIEKIEELKKIILDEEKILENIDLPSSSNDFNLGFDKEYNRQKINLDKKINLYKRHLKELRKKLDYKLTNSLYHPISIIDSFDLKNLIKLIEEINVLISKNNDFTEGFDNIILSERNRYINHLVASFIKREKYILKEKKYISSVEEIQKLQSKVETNLKEIESYEALKQSDKEGAAQYNDFIQGFLDRDDIEIKLLEGSSKFVLVRENENASNLSEGEKTAIAFSHFLVTIKALVSKSKFHETIVFIDDPISSLDGNHIFQINSILKEMLFTNDTPNGEWKLRCKQLFLSTHNFEFLNLLKELPGSKNKEARFYIERNSKKKFSDIKPLPNIYDKYSSEYHYLFKEIYEFSKLRSPLKADKILTIPNTLRRFLEMYTLTKYPVSENVDRRAEHIFTPEISKRICKPFHYFSHLDNIDRIGKKSEFIADIPDACKTLINQIKKKDKMHFDALILAVNI